MRARLRPILGILVFLALAWSTWNGFTRGGQDFRVFHYAGRLILDGRWDALYSEGPDRFLYAPGFALLISPFSALPEGPALALWLLATLFAFTAALHALAKRLGFVEVALAVLFSIRAVAIDLRYGQVNLFILASGIFALLSWAERADTAASRIRILVSWFFFSIAAFTKIYPLALFLFPVASIFGDREKPRAARAALFGACLAAVVLLVPPMWATGIYPQWVDALGRKGLPTYTHNQSFLAFLIRVFGGEPFYVLGLGGQALKFSGTIFSLNAIRSVWISFSLLALGLLARLAWRSSREKEPFAMREWLGLALCFLPAHLIWKSYFVLGIPLLAALFSAAAKDDAFLRQIRIPALILGAFLCFTSGDFLGARIAGWIEACSPFFWVHLIAVITGYAWLFSRRAPGSSSGRANSFPRARGDQVGTG